MNTIKIKLKPISPFASYLQSDTIFGHFAWGYRYIYGEEKLLEKLENINETPFVVFSDGFPKDYLSKPYLAPHDIEPEYMNEIKKYKKCEVVEKSQIIDNINKLNDEILFKNFINQENFKNDSGGKKETAILLKNSINRETFTVTEGLYSVQETFYENFEYDIYLKYQDITIEEISEVLSFISKRGFGKDKSSGKGKFDFSIESNFDGKELFSIDKSKKFFLNLSTMFYDRANLELAYGKSWTKFPKTGGNYAVNMPFKNPIIVYKSGSTFKVKNYKEFYGDAKSNVFSSNFNNHYHSGHSIGLFFNTGEGHE